MKEKIKRILEKIGVIKLVWFFRYGFVKNIKRLIGRIMKRVYKILTLRIIFPRAYNKYAKLPIEEDKVVFLEVRLPQVTNSFKVMYDEIISNYDYKVHVHFLKTTFCERKEYIARCKDMLRDIATAKYVFLNEACNVTSCIKKRKETQIIQLWHGCGAFKKFGFSTAELLFGETRKELLKYPYYRNQNFVTVSSPEVAWAYEEAMNMHDNKEAIVATGSSRTDVFFDEEFINKAYDKLHKLMPSSIGKKVILYAPTFRGRVAKAQSPNMLRVDMFKEAFEEEYVLLYKHHPFVQKPPVVEEADAEFAQDFTEAMSIEELLCVSDICISDYSSLVFEYSLFNKPLIFFSYDLSEYFDWRGFYYDYYELTPGPIFTTNREMIDYIQHIDERFDVERIKAFREKFMCACDGHATQRILEKVFGDSLNKYKKANPVPDHYHMIPTSDVMFSEQEQRLSRLKWWKEKGNVVYAKACDKVSVEKGKIGVIVQKKGSDLYYQLRRRLKKEQGLSLVVIRESGDSGEEVLKQLATCEYVVMTQASDMMNALEIRKETKVVQAWNEILPIEKFGYTSRAVRGGLEKEYLDIAPLHRNYDLVPMASEKLKDIYKGAFGMKDTSACKAIGATATDILFDKKFAANAKEKMYKLFPHAKDKKVIFYLPQYRVLTKKPTKEAFLDYGLMNEYFKNEYVIIYVSEKSTISQKDRMYKYYNEFIYDMTESMTVYECMAASDLMIGDYESQIYTYAVTDKPIILYAPDYRWYFDSKDVYFSYEELAPGPIVETTQEVINILQNLEQYDNTKQQKFKETYLTKCDGKSMDRLIAELRK